MSSGTPVDGNYDAFFGATADAMVIERNNIEHTEMTPAKQQQLEIMMAKARDELQLGCADLQRQDRYLFAKPESVLSMTLPDLALWLKGVGLARKSVDDVRERKRQQVARSRAAMHAWLSSHNPTSQTTNTHMGQPQSIR